MDDAERKQRLVMFATAMLCAAVAVIAAVVTIN